MADMILKDCTGARPQEAAMGCGPLLQTGRRTGRPLRQDVLEFVRSRGQAARADIAAALDISAGSATTLTADLIAGGFLREVESPTRDTGRGRPRVDLEPVPQAGYVVGIKFAFHRHTAVLADFAGNVMADMALPSPRQRRELDELLQEADALISGLMAQTDLSLSQVHAVGIGLPGTLDHHSGRVAWSPLLRDGVDDLAGLLQARFGRPFVLDNDTNVLALAELWFGEGRSVANFAVITIESGVGMGLVLDNQLFRGAHNMGLELGHTKVQLDGALCQCGQRGCLEAYVADYALIREAATALDQPFDSGDGADHVLQTLFDQAKAGHQSAEAIFRRAGRYLSLGLANVVQLFDPERIILSGERMQYDYLYAKDVLEEMQSLTLHEGRPPCQVNINAWGDLVWARGASALALMAMTDDLIGAEARTP